MSSIGCTNYRYSNKYYDFFTKSKVGITVVIITEVALCVIGILALTQNLPGIGILPGALLTGGGGLSLLLTIALIGCRCASRESPSPTLSSTEPLLATGNAGTARRADHRQDKQGFSSSEPIISPSPDVVSSTKKISELQQTVIGCEDIITEIASLLSIADIYSCAIVSRAWQQSFDCDPVWQMLLEREHGILSKLGDNKALYRKPGFILGCFAEQKRIKELWGNSYFYGNDTVLGGDSSNLQMLRNHLISSVSDGRYIVAADKSLGIHARFGPVERLHRSAHVHLVGFHIIDYSKMVVCSTTSARYVKVKHQTSLKCLRTFKHQKEVVEFRVLNTNTTLITFSGIHLESERQANVWDLNSGKHLKCIDAYGLYMSCIQVNDSKLICGRSNLIHIIDLESDEQMTLDNGSGIASIWADNKIVISGAWLGVIKIWDLSSYTSLQTFSEGTRVVRSLLLIDDTLVSGYEDGRIRIFDIKTNRHLGTLESHSQLTRHLPITHLLSDGNRIFAGSTAGDVMAWELGGKP